MSCCLVLSHQLTVSYSPGSYRVSAPSVRLFVWISLIVLSFPLSLSLSDSLFPALSSQLSVSRLCLLPHELAGPESKGRWSFRFQGSQDSMVQLHPRQGLNVLGVAVVTTPPHKLHQPEILLLLVISNHRLNFSSSCHSEPAFSLCY